MPRSGRRRKAIAVNSFILFLKIGRILVYFNYRFSPQPLPRSQGNHPAAAVGNQGVHISEMETNPEALQAGIGRHGQSPLADSGPTACVVADQNNALAAVERTKCKRISYLASAMPPTAPGRMALT